MTTLGLIGAGHIGGQLARLGVVDAGPLAEGWRYQKDTPAYGARQAAPELRDAIASARRYRDM